LHPPRTGTELFDSYPWHLVPDEAEQMPGFARGDADERLKPSSDRGSPRQSAAVRVFDIAAG
jgi:hypothetical protein